MPNFGASIGHTECFAQKFGTSVVCTEQFAPKFGANVGRTKALAPNFGQALDSKNKQTKATSFDPWHWADSSDKRKNNILIGAFGQSIFHVESPH